MAGPPVRRLGWTILSCFAVMAFALGALLFNLSRERLPSLAELAEKGLVVLPKPREIQPLRLIDQDGGSFLSDRLRGGWSLLFFGFTSCPDICPPTLGAMVQARSFLQDDDLRENLALYLVSVDPHRDRPQRLRDYLSYFGEGLQGVTGEHGQIAQFAGQLGVAFAKVPYEGLDGYTVDHSSQILIFNPKGHYHGFLKAPHDPQVIASSIRVLHAYFRS